MRGQLRPEKEGSSQRNLVASLLWSTSRLEESSPRVFNKVSVKATCWQPGLNCRHGRSLIGNPVGIITSLDLDLKPSSHKLLWWRKSTISSIDICVGKRQEKTRKKPSSFSIWLKIALRSFSIVDKLGLNFFDGKWRTTHQYSNSWLQGVWGLFPLFRRFTRSHFPGAFSDETCKAALIEPNWFTPHGK